MSGYEHIIHQTTQAHRSRKLLARSTHHKRMLVDRMAQSGGFSCYTVRLWAAGRLLSNSNLNQRGFKVGEVLNLESHFHAHTRTLTGKPEKGEWVQLFSTLPTCCQALQALPGHKPQIMLIWLHGSQQRRRSKQVHLRTTKGGMAAGLWAKTSSSPTPLSQWGRELLLHHTIAISKNACYTMTIKEAPCWVSSAVYYTHTPALNKAHASFTENTSVLICLVTHSQATQTEQERSRGSATVMGNSVLGESSD